MSCIFRSQDMAKAEGAIIIAAICARFDISLAPGQVKLCPKLRARETSLRYQWRTRNHCIEQYAIYRRNEQCHDAAPCSSHTSCVSSSLVANLLIFVRRYRYEADLANPPICAHETQTWKRLGILNRPQGPRCRSKLHTDVLGRTPVCT